MNNEIFPDNTGVHCPTDKEGAIVVKFFVESGFPNPKRFRGTNNNCIYTIHNGVIDSNLDGHSNVKNVLSFEEFTQKYLNVNQTCDNYAIY